MLSQLRSPIQSHHLISTLVIITTKVIGFQFVSPRLDLDVRIDLMLGAGSLQDDMFCDSPSLDQFPKACLLALYEFHQFPGQQADLDVVCEAHAHVLLDWARSPGSRSRFRPCCAPMSEDGIESWRLVWWFIHCLDSYVNFSVGTPYLIDETIVETALFPPKAELIPTLQDGHYRNSYLGVMCEPPWAMIPNLHTITITAMRQDG